jgi:hypothetical protein
MANKYVQYGAVVATGIGVAAVTKGISTAMSTGGTISSGIDAATSTATGAVSNPAFLTGVGLGLAAIALGSGSKRPSLSFPNLAATAAVALNVSNLIQQGKAAASGLAQSKAGLDISSKIGPPVALRSPAIDDPSVATMEVREGRKTYRLVHPDDLTTNYYIRFGLYRYTRSAVADIAQEITNPHTTIRLPLPANLVDAISLAYQDVGLGQFIGAGYDAFSNRMSQPGRNGQGEVMRTATAVGGALNDVINDPGFASAVARRIINSADPGLGTAFDLATGTAPNPHMVVSFQGVTLKKYQFSWRFSPNNAKESKNLERIIRNLQASALPRKSGKLLLTFPDVVNIEMMPSNLFIFKPMMIDNVAVNYAPSGSPSFFRGGDNSSDRYPSEIELTISLRELDIHTASDPDYKTIRALQDFSDPNTVSTQGTTNRT